MDTESTNHLSEREQNKEKLLTTLKEVSVVLQQFIDSKGIDRSLGELHIDENYLDLLSKKAQTGEFAFWGKLLMPGHSFYTITDETIAQIQNIQIPKPLRGKRLGSTFVKLWESALVDRGITTFIATNIKDTGVVSFWQKQGYSIPESHTTSNVPYVMYKHLPKPQAIDSLSNK